MQTFESPFGKARAVIFSDGTPWFVAKDVVEGLGLKLPVGNHINRLDNQQKCVIRQANVSTNSPCMVLFTGGVTSLSLVTQGGYNTLIRESRKPVARDYCRWVDNEVLPALQNTGTFTDKKSLI
ncbi:MAG: Bro-N domain-containing protein [Alishewanella aestuarii]